MNGTATICALAMLALSGWCSAGLVTAQERFELIAPALKRTSQAVLDQRELRVIDQAGQQTIYARTTALDSADGQFRAYQAASGQVIRWPVANSGPMQIGTLVGGRYEFRTSQMEVVAQGDPAGANSPGRRPDGVDMVLPPRAAERPATGLDSPGPRGSSGSSVEADFFGQLWQPERPEPQVLRLVIHDERGRDWYLGKSSGRALAMHGVANPDVHNWYVVPAGRGLVRVAQQQGPGWSALSAAGGRNLAFEPLGQQANQLWRVMPIGNGGGYWLESVTLPGYALTGAISGAVNLQAANGGFGQVWWPQPILVGPTFEPLLRTVSQELRVNPPLPPAQIDLVNSHSEALRILVADRRTQVVRQVRLEPNSRLGVAFDRDAGVTLVETYELSGPGGLWDRQIFTTQIPPTTLYDLSIYEEFLQSIAIDRTGTSPNSIEDVNYQPKSVGWLPLPPGSALPARGQIDAYQDAKAQNNPGAVRRYDPRSLEKLSTQPDPLKAILDEVSPKVRQKF